MKKPLTKFLIIYFIILNIIDLITTTYGYYHFHWFPETNPIYNLIKNYWIFQAIAKLIVAVGILALLHLFRIKINLIRYLSISFFVLFILLYTSAMIDNIKSMGNTEDDITQIKESIEKVAEQQNISVAKAKVNIYKERFINPLYISLVIMAFIFVIYERLSKENL